MCDGNDRARILIEEALEPGDGLGIEVVGRLVEQQHVGLRQQETAQCDAAPFAARQLGYVRIPGRQSQRIRRNLELAVHFPATGRVDRVLQFPLFLEQRIHLVVGHRLGEFLADLVETVQQLDGLAETFLDIAAHVLLGIQLGLLRQVADLDACLRASLAFEFLVDAGHDAQHRRLASAIEAKHAYFCAGEEGERDVTDDESFRRHDLGHAIHRVDVLRH